MTETIEFCALRVMSEFKSSKPKRSWLIACKDHAPELFSPSIARDKAVELYGKRFGLTPAKLVIFQGTYRPSEAAMELASRFQG